jgi:hypothetical protein
MSAGSEEAADLTVCLGSHHYAVIRQLNYRKHSWGYITKSLNFGKGLKQLILVQNTSFVRKVLRLI